MSDNEDKYKQLIELIETNPDWFKQCHKNKGTAILCICDKCIKELREILGDINE